MKEERGAILRRRTKHDDDLPDEIVLDIFARLPVKSLLRFRCVCKPWYSSIANPRFITFGIFPNLHLGLHVLAVKSVLSHATIPMKPYPSLEFLSLFNLGFPTLGVHVMEYCVSLIIQQGLKLFTCGTPVLENLRGCPITSFPI